MDNAKVSIIIPIYNVEKYLNECMDSVVNQTLKEIEIICIDDGSSDDSGRIIDEYALKDRRIRVIHKDNTGYGNSMNIGMSNASGKYIGIVEPDDFISLDMYEQLYNIAEKEDADVVKSNFIMLKGDKSAYQLIPTRIYSDDGIYDRLLDKDEKKLLFKGYITHWSSIYNREFLEDNNIVFNETPGASFQDAGFWFQTMIYSRKFYLHDGYYYHYRCDNPNSSMFNVEKIFCLGREYDHIFNIIKRNKGIFQEYLPIYVYCRFMGFYGAIDRVGDKYKLEFIKRIAQDISNVKEKGLLDMSFMNEDVAMSVNEIMENPVEYYNNKVMISKCIHKVIEKYEYVYIYGAGAMGTRIYKKFFDEDRKKMLGFVVTRKNGCADRIEDRNVYEWDKLEKSLSNIGIIVGVTKKFEDEIVELLRSANISNIILISDIIDNGGKDEF